MDDLQILQLITVGYGRKLEGLTIEQKFALIALLALNFDRFGKLPPELVQLGSRLTLLGTVELLELVVAQLRDTLC